MYRFDDLETLEATLLKLGEREPPLVKKLPRLPGTKEPRYAQLLAGEKSEWNVVEEQLAVGASHPSDDRIPRLEAEVAELKRQLDDLQQQFVQFKKQFE
jgi:uncharacterized protein YceH (UPF0502 family)